MRAYPLLMSYRGLFSILVAIALLFAPAAMRADEASAAAPDHHEMQMMDQTGACHMPSGSADHEKSMGKNCCISMCMAVAIAPSTSMVRKHVRAEQPNFFVPREHHGYLGEIATPPPRIA